MLNRISRKASAGKKFTILLMLFILRAVIQIKVDKNLLCQKNGNGDGKEPGAYTAAPNPKRCMPKGNIAVCKSKACQAPEDYDGDGGKNSCQRLTVGLAEFITALHINCSFRTDNAVCLR